MASLHRKTTGWLFPALVSDAPEAPEALDVSELTVKEIAELVESGDLQAEAVYEAELAGKQRKSVLETYAPAKADEDENDEGTTAED